MALNTHQWTKLQHQQVGSDLSALGQTLQQSRMLEGTGEQTAGREQDLSMHILFITFKHEYMF